LSKAFSEKIKDKKRNDKQDFNVKKDVEKKLKSKQENSEIDEIEKSVANEIIENGDPIKTILNTHATMHVGDDVLAKTLLVSIGIQSVKNSDGIQPKVSGDSGKGKTHCCKAMIHLIPKEYKFTTTLSDRAIYYMDIEPGSIIFSDDVDLSETLEGIIKRSTSNFQEGDNYTTLNVDRKKSELTIPPRIVWWLTSVDDDQSLQLLNRQFGGSVDESFEQDKKVFDYQCELAITGRVNLPENQEVRICRYIIEDIKQQLYTVLIPYTKCIMWDEYSNRRNFPIFLDIIKSFAVLRHRQREKAIDDETIIYATIADFNDACELYISRAKHQATKLTTAEIEFCETISDGKEHTYEEIQVTLGITQGRISQLLHGRKKDGTGLLDKVSGLSVEKQSIQKENGRTVYKNICILHNFDPDMFKTQTIKLKENTEKRFK